MRWKGNDMSNIGYDMEADMALKKAGNRLHEALMIRSGLEGWKAFGFSTGVLTEALGYVPFGDGPNTLSDAETRAAIPRVEGMLAIVEALNAETARQAETAAGWKKLIRRYV